MSEYKVYDVEVTKKFLWRTWIKTKYYVVKEIKINSPTLKNSTIVIKKIFAHNMYSGKDFYNFERFYDRKILFNTLNKALRFIEREKNLEPSVPTYEKLIPVYDTKYEKSVNFIENKLC